MGLRGDVKISGSFINLGPNNGAKGVFLGLSQFFYVNAKVRISDVSTFFEGMILKLCTDCLSNITEYVGKCFVILPTRVPIMGKKGFSKNGT